MLKCSKEIRKFHDDRVKLPQKTTQQLKHHRNSNRERLRRGLEKNGDPLPDRSVRQGSDAMHTTVQHPQNDFDIDDGVVFNREDLVGKRGAEKKALEARWMVCDALQDASFKTPPEIRENCVRVYYNEGYHVDIPVYRQKKGDSSTVYELASSDWRATNPEGVTEWFQQQLDGKHPPRTKSYQLRRIVRYLKYFATSRPSWNMPSGFIWTVLVNECFSWPEDEHDDVVLRQVMRKVRNRLRQKKSVQHPVLEGETITKTLEDACMKDCETRLTRALESLEVLDDTDCTQSRALRAWRDVFGTDYFNDLIEQAEAAERQHEARRRRARKLVASVPAAHRPKPWAVFP